MPAEESTTSSESVIISDKCLKCGTIKASGKLSCCARGGAWFKQCGDVGDDKFDHAWAEGIQACKSKFLRGQVLHGCVVVCVVSFNLIVLLHTMHGIWTVYLQ